MRKFLIALIMLIILSSASYGASEDIYVRQDVFDAKMEALFARLDAKIGELRTEMKNEISGLRSEISSLRGEVKEEISSLRGDIRELTARVDGVEKRMDNMNTFLYYLLVLLGALILLPPVSRWFEARKEAQKSLTIEDVIKLIEEHDAKRASMYAAAAK